ncbi:MAG: zinc ribbon domain-containing protein [Nanoarchaeota archaeon]|nr:zinc ribbon domain-containing protein [Nanoarchaeota archaeon]
MGSNIDLRKFQDTEAIENAFGALVSGKKTGYKTVIERKKPKPKCNKCGRFGDEEQKFCRECGGKMVIPMTNCPSCKASIEEIDKFCPGCGFKLKE